MPAAGNRTDQGYLARLPSTRLPKEVVGDIFSKAKDQSILLALGQEIPVGINETVITTGDTYPEAGQVGAGTSLAAREGAEKPIQGIQFGGQRSFAPIKLAVIVTVSDEFADADVDGLYSNLAGKLSGAIARAADLAAFHNRDAITGQPLIGTEASSFVNATGNRIELNFRSDAQPDLVDQILAGVELVEDDEEANYEVNGFAAVSRMRTKLVTRRDKNGNPIFVGQFPGSGADINLNAPMGSLFGLPISFGRSVRGKLGAFPGTAVKMFAGDWSQLAWGFADEIKIKASDQATVGGVSMWQTNQIAVLAEATFGWCVGDPSAFVAYDDAVADIAPTP